MLPLRYRIKSVDGDVRAEIERETCPVIGDTLLVFDYPHVARYVVDRLEERSDALVFDALEPQQIVLRKIATVEQSNRARRGVRTDLSRDLIARTEKIGELARTYITQRLTLEICYADLQQLFSESGLVTDIASVDLFLFGGIPMAVGEKDHDWNAYTAFTGYSDDMSVLYVTLPGGQPFVMEPRFLEIVRRMGRSEILEEDEAIEDVCLFLLDKGLQLTDAVVQRIRNTVSLAFEGLLPPYDAAQELVRVTMPLTAGCRDVVDPTGLQER